MKIDELIKLISYKSGNFVSQSMLAESLGITRQTVSNRIKNQSEVTVSELQKAENYFCVKLFDSADSEQGVIYVDYYSDVFASCGGGSIVFSSSKTKLPLSASMIRGYSKSKLYSMINATVNSMSPTIEVGDKLIVEHWNCEQIQDDKIYVFCYNERLYCKYLSYNVNQIIVRSANKDYPTRFIEKENMPY